VNASELAKHLSSRFPVTQKTILEWAKRGLIPRLPVPRRPVLFDVAEVEVAISERNSLAVGR
jgi:hypothetical protein